MTRACATRPGSRLGEGLRACGSKVRRIPGRAECGERHGVTNFMEGARVALDGNACVLPLAHGSSVWYKSDLTCNTWMEARGTADAAKKAMVHIACQAPAAGAHAASAARARGCAGRQIEGRGEPPVHSWAVGGNSRRRPWSAGRRHLSGHTQISTAAVVSARIVDHRVPLALFVQVVLLMAAPRRFQP